MTDELKPPSPIKRRPVRVKPHSYRPSKAELEEDVGVDATPEGLAECIGRTVAVPKTKGEA